MIQGESEDVPRGLSDPDLAALIGSRDWVLISKDVETRYRPNEREAIVRTKLRVFQLTRGAWTAGEMITALMNARLRMHRLLRRQRAPFIARINKRGDISTILTEEHLRGKPAQ